MKTKRKRTAVLILVLLMILAVAACNIDLGTNKINIGQIVWFGNYNGAPVKWRVLGDGNDGGGNSRLLLSDFVLADIQFDSSANAWQGSNAQSWCEGFYNNAFSPIEKTALLKTSKNDVAYDSEFYPASDAILNEEYVFFLSAEEADTVFSMTTIGSQNV